MLYDPQFKIELPTIGAGDDYTFNIVPSYSIAGKSYSSAIKNPTTGTIVANWIVSYDIPLNRVYFKLSNAQTTIMDPGQYVYDIREVDNAVIPPEVNHDLWGYVEIKETIT